jgi:hypothetical protein
VIATLAGAIGSFLQKRGEELDDKRRPVGARKGHVGPVTT